MGINPKVEVRPSNQPGKVWVDTPECPGCGEETSFLLNADAVSAWVGGELIQDALNMLTDGERERLISGYCPKCWDEFVEDDD